MIYNPPKLPKSTGDAIGIFGHCGHWLSVYCRYPHMIPVVITDLEKQGWEFRSSCTGARMWYTQEHAFILIFESSYDEGS